MDATVVGQIVGAVIGALLFGFLIWLISKFNLGIKVDNYGWAVSAGVVISAISNLAGLIIPDMNGLIGAIISVVVAAIVILISDKILRGMHVNGFSGAVIAAIVIGIVQGLLIFVMAFAAQGAA